MSPELPTCCLNQNVVYAAIFTPINSLIILLSFWIFIMCLSIKLSCSLFISFHGLFINDTSAGSGVRHC